MAQRKLFIALLLTSMSFTVRSLSQVSFTIAKEGAAASIKPDDAIMFVRELREAGSSETIGHYIKKLEGAIEGSGIVYTVYKWTAERQENGIWEIDHCTQNRTLQGNLTQSCWRWLLDWHKQIKPLTVNSALVLMDRCNEADAHRFLSRHSVDSINMESQTEQLPWVPLRLSDSHWEALSECTKPSGASVVVHAIANCFTHVIVDGTPVFEGLIPRGATMEWMPIKSIVLKTSTPNSIQVTVGGVPRRFGSRSPNGEYRIDVH